ncbi:thioesterase II family protein [Streptomyces sp. AC550_RSS872]|uniref:thioesterase II family protein n=1 Tax=Streptomyces sp. AC550_RSS872 TaxID=2823689 RepID=UPI001C2598D0|nr:alpha/beta fold hydrolase [Streptomyces sp. AC550_RSS872]
MHSNPPTRPWINRLSKTNPPGSIRLFCFPYAGGGASTFRGWAELLPDEVDVHAIQPPGREDRLFEDPVDTLKATLDAVVPELLAYSKEPFALFGHSLGAIVCWEAARVLREEHNLEPAHVFLSGCRALPAVHDGRRDLHTLPEAELIEELRLMNGTPEEILRNSDFMRLLLPAVRADYAMLSRYSFLPCKPPGAPVTVFGGASDPGVGMNHLQQWSELVEGELDAVVLPGDHFFLHSSREPLLAEMTKRLVGPVQTSGRKSSLGSL